MIDDDADGSNMTYWCLVGNGWEWGIGIIYIYIYTYFWLVKNISYPTWLVKVHPLDLGHRGRQCRIPCPATLHGPGDIGALPHW